MGQSWQRPEHEPRKGKLEVWVERARNLAPEAEPVLRTWTDAAVYVVVQIPMGDGRTRHAETTKKVGLRHGLRENAPIFQEKVAAWADISYPPYAMLTATVVYARRGGENRKLGLVRVPTRKYWAIEQPVEEPTGPSYHWIAIESIAGNGGSPGRGASGGGAGGRDSRASVGSAAGGQDEGRRDTGFRGEVKLAAKWTQTEPEYRGWVWCLYSLVATTQRCMKPISSRGGDRVLDWLLEAVLLGLLHRVLYLRLLQPLYTGGKRIVRRRGRGPIALFFSLMLGSCILPFLLALLPLLLLWPITLFVLSTTTVLLLALTPLGALGLWLLFAAKPVQEKLMRPLLLASLRLTYPRRVLTLPRAPGW